MGKPKDRTAVFALIYDAEGEILEDLRTDVYYSSIDDPLALPPPVLCGETIDEWAEFKKWEIDEIAREAKEKLAKKRWYWKVRQ